MSVGQLKMSSALGMNSMTYAARLELVSVVCRIVS